MRYRLEYVAKGEATRRDVRLISAGLDGIRAACELREAVRTFRFDRVKRATSLDTGEIFTTVQFKHHILGEVNAQA